MKLPVDDASPDPDDIGVPSGPPPRDVVDPREHAQLVARVDRMERHIGLAAPGPAQLDFGPERLAKVVGIVGLDLTDENVEAVRRVLSAANLVNAGAV